ncbi:MAG: SDR family NAD(P)-dependent oxidoreductase, partial [Bacteroidetes bacterium]|nr:SDR family NAD(P)-dependent oxidoreductase [Bacteroidota bacterium]
MNPDITYNFNGKVALVTGAASGIGLATAKLFAQAGAAVVMAGNDMDHIQRATKEVGASGAKVLPVPCDVAVEAQVQAMVEATVKAFGRLDFAYNNAGIMSRNTETSDLTAEEWDRVI